MKNFITISKTKKLSCGKKSLQEWYESFFRYLAFEVIDERSKNNHKNKILLDSLK